MGKNAVKRQKAERSQSNALLAIFMSAAVVVVIILGFVVFGLRYAGSPARRDATVARPAVPSAAVLPPAPDFEVIMYQGGEVVGGGKLRLSQVWGRGKPVVMNFWAGLCPPCRTELPDFQELYNARGATFTLIGIDIDPFIGLGSREEGKALLRELKITFPAGTTFDKNALTVYRIVGMPTTVFITPTGKIQRKHTGLLNVYQMNSLLDELLRGSGVQ